MSRRISCLVRRFATTSSARRNNDKIVQSTAITQQGNEIQELPVIFRKIGTNRLLESAKKPSYPEDALLRIKPEEIILLLDDCKNINEILHTVNIYQEATIPLEISIHAFNRILSLVGAVDLKNLEDSSLVFNRFLVGNILKNGNSQILIELLTRLKFFDLYKTTSLFCDELLLRNSDGILNVVEICECIDLMAETSSAERFWTGITDNEINITENNIIFIFRILPKVKTSRRLVSSVLERRIPDIWFNLKADTIVESLRILQTCGISPHRILHSYARWLNTNNHAIKEYQLEEVVQLFRKIDFSNGEIERALERYMKAKGVGIKTQTLVVEILNFSLHFRIRNNHILNGCCEYFISHSDFYHPRNLKALITTLGFLNFKPLSGVRFWMVVEDYIKKNFGGIEPGEVINLFLNCCYLEIYPLNFVSSVFNPNFLDRLYSRTPDDLIPQIRSNLKLLDASMTLESDNYSGPLLPRDHTAKSLWQDGRVKRMINSLTPHMENITRSSKHFTNSVIVGKLPTNSLYIVDVLIHPPGMTNFWSYSIFNDRNVYIAVLIHLPEYFDSTGEFLIGPQEMRIRHLRKLGLKVVTLNFSKLSKLQVHPKQLNEYLVGRMKEALPSLK